MDSRKFATSLSQEQKKFIAERRDGHLKLANTCVNEYKDNPSEELIRRIQSNLACVSALDYLSNQFAPLESRKAYQELTDIKDNHEKNRFRLFNTITGGVQCIAPTQVQSIAPT